MSGNPATMFVTAQTIPHFSVQFTPMGDLGTKVMFRPPVFDKEAMEAF
jgi:hypothetical protein